MSVREPGRLAWRVWKAIVGGSVAAIVTVAAPTLPATGTEISVSYAFPSVMQAPLEELADRFMADHPDITVTFTAPAAAYEELTQSALRGVAIGSVPDVMMHGYHRVALLAERGAVVALDDFAGREAALEAAGYTRAARELCMVGETLYGLPIATSTQIVYYNVDLIRASGGDLDAPPTDWNGVLALAQQIDPAGGTVTPLFFDYKGAGNWGFLALVFSHDGRMMSADGGELRLDGPEGMAALELLRRFGEAGQVDMTRSQAMQAFAAGSIGILVFTSSALNAIEDQAEGRFDVRTGPFPISAPGGTIPAGGVCAMVFSEEAERQQAAWRFVEFAAGPVGQTIMALTSGYMPNNTVAITDPDLLGAFYDDNPNHRTSVEQIPAMTGFWTWPGPNSIRIQELIEDHLVEVATLLTPPDEAMADIVAAVRPLLPREE